MLESISPYALLKASVPKEPHGIVTAYDLYSAAQSAAPSAQQSPPMQRSAPPTTAPAQPKETATVPPSAPPQAYRPVRRTHYIRDIETRHDAAMRRTRLGTGGLVHPSQRPQT